MIILRKIMILRKIKIQRYWNFEISKNSSRRSRQNLTISASEMPDNVSYRSLSVEKSSFEVAKPQTPNKPMNVEHVQKSPTTYPKPEKDGSNSF